MSNVGWNEPKAPAAPTVAVHNGDGTGTITNSDGTVVAFCSECTVDTFATLSGSTITMADGSTIDIPAGSTYNAATNTITTSDGSVVPLMTDTDTFATFDAASNSITMADGTVVPVGGTDTAATLSGTIINFPDGQTIDVSPSEIYRTTETTPDTVANATTDNAGKSLEVDNLDWLLTNKAVEIGARGVRNTDGSQGWWKQQLPSVSNDATGNLATTIDPVSNGAAFNLRNDTLDTTPINLANGKYAGQVLHLTNRSSVEPVVVAGVLFFGVNMREGDDKTYSDSPASSVTDISLRVSEHITLRWLSNRWYIDQWEKRPYHDTNWRENMQDGTYDYEGNLPVNPAAYPAFTNTGVIVEDTANGTFIAQGATL